MLRSLSALYALGFSLGEIDELIRQGHLRIVWKSGKINFVDVVRN